MKYKITRKYVFLDKEPVLMYFIEHMPFQFDSLDRIEKEDIWVLSEAASNEEYTLTDVIISSEYFFLILLLPIATINSSIILFFFNSCKLLYSY